MNKLKLKPVLIPEIKINMRLTRMKKRKRRTKKKWGKVGAPHSKKRKLWLKRIRKKR